MGFGSRSSTRLISRISSTMEPTCLFGGLPPNPDGSSELLQHRNKEKNDEGALRAPIAEKTKGRSSSSPTRMPRRSSSPSP